MTTVRLGPDGATAPAPDPVLTLPRRVRLSRPAVEHLAALTCTPLPWADAPGPGRTGRLGPPTAPAATGAHDAEAELREAGLVGAMGDVHPEVAGALAVFGAPEAIVDIDLSVRRDDAPAGFAQVRSWQRRRRGLVTTLATAGGRLELGWFDDEAWQADLARTLTVRIPHTGARPPRRVLDLPHELLLGTGEALRLCREDVFDELVARHAGSVLADDRPLPLGRADSREQVRLLHTSALGRMRTVVSGVGATGTRKVGWVGWVLFPDGWRALTPHTRDHGARVRVHPVDPLRLGVEVARLVTLVTS